MLGLLQARTVDGKSFAVARLHRTRSRASQLDDGRQVHGLRGCKAERMAMKINRIVCWFSCGAASAVATKLAIVANAGRIPLEICYCRVEEEHADNMRFLRDCEQWFGQSVTIMRNEKYQGSIYNVFEQSRYLVGPSGARCTLELKKRMRLAFQRPTDRHVFGYTAEEQAREDQLIDSNADLDIWSPLIEKNLLKSDVKAMVERAGIELPAMYRLGYANANCIGCVKGGAGYWNKIRVDFPDTFARMARTERLLGRQVCKVTTAGVTRRVFLDELPPDAGDPVRDQPGDCGIFCYQAEREIAECEV